MASAHLAKLQQTYDDLKAEHARLHDQVEALSAQEKEIHERQQAAVRKRNAVQSSLTSLLSLISEMRKEEGLVQDGPHT